jgi:SAM-dependent methyltransferase
MHSSNSRLQGAPPPSTIGEPRQALFRAQAYATSARAPETPSQASVLEERLRVLHVGCGVNSATRLHPLFRTEQWDEIRLDIDQSTCPDISGSIIDMREFAEDESCDAIWASHVLEHLAQHEVGKALREFRRVLVPSGFALIRTPDIESVAQFILDGRIRDVVYTSPAGPITPLDMLYGHGASIEKGAEAMRHGTAFTQDSMAEGLLQAGFAELRVTRTDTFEVWAIAFMPEADVTTVLDKLAGAGIDLRA